MSGLGKDMGEMEEGHSGEGNCVSINREDGGGQVNGKRNGRERESNRNGHLLHRF